MINLCANQQHDYEEADFSSSCKDEFSIVEKALTTMKKAQPISATPIEEPVSEQACLVKNLQEVTSLSSHEMAESIKAEEQIYYTLCEDEESTGPAYCVPSSDEQTIYEEYEGKRFHKLYHKDIV